jgi:hypothetical protein
MMMDEYMYRNSVKWSLPNVMHAARDPVISLSVCLSVILGEQRY